ncbi:MAG: hypothetical protein KatS3mg121_0375 [Gammaproteobacteria bacterium]|nr:MAG: hypothetical protein KatS3mg121_0375 [Gammaproteobacteria bacterium]
MTRRLAAWLCTLLLAGPAAGQGACGRADCSGPVLGRAEAPPAGERLLPDLQFTLWVHDEDDFRPSGEDTVELRTTLQREARTVKLTDVVEPIGFATGRADIPDTVVERLRTVLAELENKPNLRLHIIGHTDNQPLGPRGRALYGDNVGLSEARARMAAEFFQRALGLPPEAVTFEGRGAAEPIADNATPAGRARNRRVEVQVWYDEIEERRVQERVEKDPGLRQVPVCRRVERCLYKRKQGQRRRIQVVGAVPPLHYDGTQVELDERHLIRIRDALAELRDLPGLSLRVVAHTDNLPLPPELARLYGDKLTLSKALAGRLARELAETLRLPNRMITAVGKGETEPVASNADAQGRALNRRIEIEIWHDDPDPEAVETPRPCPGAAQSETVTAVYQDEKPVVFFKAGDPVYPNGFFESVRRILDTLRDKPGLRINVVGHTSNEALSRRAAALYGDHFKLSLARAERVKAELARRLGLPEDRLLTEGRGFLEPYRRADDSPFARLRFEAAGAEEEGTVDPRDNRVELEFLYEEAAELVEDPNLVIERVQVDEPPVSPFLLQPIRISVDGQPVDDGRRHGADEQRCIDRALAEADLQLRYDPLGAAPRLDIQALPPYLSDWDDPATRRMENKIRFVAYSNYSAFIARAEVRIHHAEDSLQAEPLAVLPLNDDGQAEWWTPPPLEPFAGPVQPLKYVLRVYDAEGRWDQTEPQPIWLVSRVLDPAAAEALEAEIERAGWGESRLAQRRIPVRGGVVTVAGRNLPPGHRVWVMGRRVPVGEDGRFVAEQIVPPGYHTVEVAVLDERGNGRLYLRDLHMAENDWFLVGLADLVLGRDETNGPASLVTQDPTHYNSEFWADGRLAFYTKGRTEGGWTVTASADTREQPIDELFSNFDKKDPDTLFRRLDPDRHYPTFGDDSVLIEDAPTSGRFYLRAEKDQDHVLWGNFKARWLDTELAQVDRVLYGAQLHLESDAVTELGERRSRGELYLAQPGTVLARDEFRGTGGSLYYLRNRDITQGSERLRIEVRDKDSGIVLSTRELVWGQDYDIDYIQGRILLNQPLPSTADDGRIVQTDGLGGHPVFLVARYEYTPGFEEIDDTSRGLRLAHWFGDHLQLGLTAADEDRFGERAELGGVDLVLRKTAQTYVKLESARSRGPGWSQRLSEDGGFNFFDQTLDAADDRAHGAWRLEAAGLFSELFDFEGRLRLYLQQREAGFAAPGQLAPLETEQHGLDLELPIGSRWTVAGRFDAHRQQQGLDSEAAELEARYTLDEHWRLGSALRRDRREDQRAGSLLPADALGERTDLGLEVAYDSRDRWTGYGFLQSTLDTAGGRAENDRIGVGGRYQLSDRWRLDGEISDGDLGAGGRLGLDFLASDRTQLYFAYQVDTDRDDFSRLAGRSGGRQGRGLVGLRSRYSDALSVYGEERYAFGEQPSGLTHAWGLDWNPVETLALGLAVERGELQDPFTGLVLDRSAYSFSTGWRGDALRAAAALEWREDASLQDRRTTRLWRSNLEWRLGDDGRLLAKYNAARSRSNRGAFYDGDFTEAVLGYAYRPVAHDRLNLLFKLTWFENLPAPEQESLPGTRSEFIQKSRILSIDGNYRLTARWTLGAKWARRLGEVALDRSNPEFFASNADLTILRVDWHLVHSWDWLIEGRRLAVEQAQDERAGFLTALYKHLGRHVKLGVGYNFTDFSDDLTDLDYDSQGAFINLVGKF